MLRGCRAEPITSRIVTQREPPASNPRKPHCCDAQRITPTRCTALPKIELEFRLVFNQEMNQI
jgi:hypothetical protein